MHAGSEFDMHSPHRDVTRSLSHILYIECTRAPCAPKQSAGLFISRVLFESIIALFVTCTCCITPAREPTSHL